MPLSRPIIDYLPFNNVFQPLYRTTINGNRIKTAGRSNVITLQIGLRGQHQTALLGRGNRCCRTAEPAFGTAAHFHKNQCAVILHDEINFSERAPEIAFDVYQSLIVQKLQGQLFTLPAELLRIFRCFVPPSHLSDPVAKALKVGQ